MADADVPALELRAQALEGLRRAAAGDSRARVLALNAAQAMVDAAPALPLAHVTLGLVLADARTSSDLETVGGEAEAEAEGEGRLVLERAWQAFRQALALQAHAPDEAQAALCTSSLAAIESRLVRAEAGGSAAAAAALARMREAAPAEAPPLLARVLSDGTGEGADAADAPLALAAALPAAPMRVTLLSGFLGAGKTTLLQHVLHNTAGWQVAVVVNDMSELNIDARLVRAPPRPAAPAPGTAAPPAAAPAAVRSAAREREREREVVELSNGCICCTLRDDLVDELARLARMGRFEYCIVESTGVSEPLAVAHAFARADAHGVSLHALARLDTMVSVVDAAAFFADLSAGDTLQQRRMAVSAEDARDLGTLMAQQVEAADVLVLNKADLAPPQRVAQVCAYLRAVNPAARLLVTSHARVDVGEVVATGRFNLGRVAATAGWVRELSEVHTPESEAYGVRAHAYERGRPFDAARLWAIIAGDPPALRSVLRSKGYAWVTQQPAYVLEWQTAGVDVDCRVAGRWHDAPPDSAAHAHGTPASAFGARGTELVFIGLRLDGDALEALLDGALATDAELAALEDARADHGALRPPRPGDVLAPVPDGMAPVFAAADAMLGADVSQQHQEHHDHSHTHAA